MLTHHYTPEAQLLNYYCEGIPRHGVVSSVDWDNIVSGLSQKRLLIYFPFYWSHDDVSTFKRSISNVLNPEHILAVTNNLYNLLLARSDSNVHWIERINLFHLFGLVRIYGKTLSKEALEFLNSVWTQPNTGMGNAFIVVSAINAKSILENRDPKDESEFFALAERSPAVVRDYGNYQIFYHGGVHECISELRSDLKENHKVPVPSSVLSLLVSCDLRERGDDVQTRIRDELYAPLHPETKRDIDRIYSKIKHSLVR